MVGYNRYHRLVIQRRAHKLRYDERQVSSNVTGLWRCRLNSKAARRSELPVHGYLSSVVVPEWTELKRHQAPQSSEPVRWVSKACHSTILHLALTEPNFQSPLGRAVHSLD
jgi:hypothetical protein